mmetsp:Transcript_22914/g.36447  ORF Transcript_22914/g.36447 Transcript_22914/m.36447 type:complete len:97 (+) Transcript_22914:536-826(+)
MRFSVFFFVEVSFGVGGMLFATVIVFNQGSCIPALIAVPKSAPKPALKPETLHLNQHPRAKSRCMSMYKHFQCDRDWFWALIWSIWMPNSCFTYAC